MKDENKTKKRLIIELTELRVKVAELERMKNQQDYKIDTLNKNNEPNFQQPSCFTDALYIIFDRKLEYVNQAFEDLFDYSADEICRPEFEIMNLVAPQYRNFVKKIFDEGIRGDRSLCQFEFSMLRKDGSIFECETLVIFIPYKWGMAIQGIVSETSIQKNINEYSSLPDKIEMTIGL
ncbi:MAG: PAS domain S-box protein [Syntrophales bacterium]|jgi:PAS domain S-box-containing protein